LPDELRAAGLNPAAVAALVRIVKQDSEAALGLASLVRLPPTESEQNPLEKSLWMLVADFFFLAVPILPFALAPVARARYISTAVTLALLVLLCVGRARVAGLGFTRTDRADRLDRSRRGDGGRRHQSAGELSRTAFPAVVARRR